MSDFVGFPLETGQFLQDLSQNNDREWFTANKKRYETFVKEPSVAWVRQMGTRLQDIDSRIIVDERSNGSGNLMRMARDTRFSNDKSPYKTNIAMMWWIGAGKKTQCPAFGMQITPDDAGVVAGMFGFDKEQLDRYRQAVDEDESGEALEQVIADVKAAGYEIFGEHYKTTPRGYDKDHPRADLLKYAGLYVHPSQNITWDVVNSGDLLEVSYEHFRKMNPILQWLVDRGI